MGRSFNFSDANFVLILQHTVDIPNVLTHLTDHTKPCYGRNFIYTPFILVNPCRDQAGPILCLCFLGEKNKFLDTKDGHHLF